MPLNFIRISHLINAEAFTGQCRSDAKVVSIEFQNISSTEVLQIWIEINSIKRFKDMAMNWMVSQVRYRQYWKWNDNGAIESLEFIHFIDDL